MKFFRKMLVIASLLLSFSNFAIAQSGYVLKGTVLDETDFPLAGVAIMTNGTNGVVTAGDGTFELKVNASDVLKVSCLGYESQEIKISGQQDLKIVLKEDSTLLDEVVMVAYGTVKAKNFTGSVESVNISNSPIADLGITSASDLLKGQVTGVQFETTSSVRSSTSLQVRGQKNLNGGGSPMLVVDGVIYKGSLDDINPSSIESMSVLKDASSLASYGSQAADGVIMITTKKGKSGKPIINFQTNVSFSSPTYKPKYYDGAGYIQLRNARVGNYDNLNDTSFMTNLEKKNYAAGNETDWYDLVTRTGIGQDYQLSFSGATDRTNYYIGVGHTIKAGATVGDDLQRTNINSNVSTHINNNIQIGLNTALNYSKQDGGVASTYANALALTPYGSAYFDNTGVMRKYPDGLDSSNSNPLWNTSEYNESLNVSQSATLTGFLSVDAPWVKGLNYRINVSYSISNNNTKSFQHEQFYPSMASGNNEDNYETFSLVSANGSSAYTKSTNWVIDNILTYSRQFGQHYVNASAVYTRDSSLSESESMSGSDYSELGNTLLGWYALNLAGTRTVSANSYSLHNDIGYLLRGMYSFKDTYHFNASFRRDGSSVFGKDRKWGNFPAVGVAWTMSNEPFMKNISFLDNLKVKFSWGKNGSQTLSPYGTLSRLSMGRESGATIITGQTGQINYGQMVTTIGNSELGWQTTTSYNAGVESAFLGNRITFEGNVYKSITTDQISSRTIPIMGSGVSTQTATMGRVDNWGIEWSINTNNIRKNDFSWSTMLNFNLNRNVLKELWPGQTEDDYTNELFLGRSLNEVWWYEYDGIVQNDGKGSFYTTPGYPNVLDKDGSGGLDRYDKSFLGHSKENFTMNLANTITWKGLQVYILFNGVFGGNNYALANNTFAYYTNYGMAYGNSLSVPYYTPSNPSNKYVSAEFPASNDPYWRVYTSYAHIRLQNLNVSYDLTPLVKNFGFSGARVSLSGSNLFYIAPKWKLSDPSSRSVNGYLMRSITCGVNLSF